VFTKIKNLFVKKPYWTTAEGKRIAVSKMGTRHLINTIQLLERACRLREQNAILACHSGMVFLQGEMAQDSLEREISGLEEYGLDIYTEFPIYEHLEKELKKRKAEALKMFDDL
jgi:hypothetical protein